MAPIEVEKKFLVTEAVRTALQSLETEPTHHHSFQDTYFDTLNFSLYLNDYWLRKRDTCWELKYPLLQPSVSSANATTQYHETKTDAEVITQLTSLLGNSTSVSSIAELLESHNLQSFVNYTTRRQSLKHKEFTIDIDETDFGYTVGEVELMVDSQDQVAQAVAKIEEFLKTLGVTVLKKAPSKMEEYLKKHNLELFQRLEAQKTTAKIDR